MTSSTIKRKPKVCLRINLRDICIWPSSSTVRHSNESTSGRLLSRKNRMLNRFSDGEPSNLIWPRLDFLLAAPNHTGCRGSYFWLCFLRVDNALRQQLVRKPKKHVPYGSRSPTC